VNPKVNFAVDRPALVDSCVGQLVGGPDEGGHYFTIWAPRQTGKTWLMRQARDRVRQAYGDRFVVADISMQGVVLEDDDPVDKLLEVLPWHLQLEFGFPQQPVFPDWNSFAHFFSLAGGYFDRPLVLLIDEFDSLPRATIDRLVQLFRNMYLKRDSYLLHGLALIGVRAVLGLDSQRGSPFNVQRSLHVPNLTEQEVAELFRQYQEESGQEVDPWVVGEVFRVTRGQPGLANWFGELLTGPHKYNPGREKTIGREVWENVWLNALTSEYNTNVLNLVRKVRDRHTERVIELFADPNVPFALDADWCSYLYTNGVIDSETVPKSRGQKEKICRFSCPLVQRRLYNALTMDLAGDRLPILAVEMLDDLADVFDGPELDLPALLERYRKYLARLRAKGLNPWVDQPRRADLRLTEAVGHFHLYAWLQQAVGRRCVISPEFPTGNGKVDLHVRHGDRQGIIEVKSFIDRHELQVSREQAARYAGKLGLDRVTLAVFAPTQDEEVLRRISGAETIGGVEVATVAIPWGEEAG
jgi:hypothetical protein